MNNLAPAPAASVPRPGTLPPLDVRVRMAILEFVAKFGPPYDGDYVGDDQPLGDGGLGLTPEKIHELCRVLDATFGTRLASASSLPQTVGDIVKALPSR